MTDKKLTTSNLKNFRKKFNNKKIGLAHGVFDLFHYGHLQHLQKASKLCDILVVSITSKKFVNKGPGRPIYNDNQRLEILNSLDIIDHTFLSHEKSANQIIKLLKPNIYFKGEEYAVKKNDFSKKIISEEKELKKFGGKIFFTKEPTLSSTNLINRFSGELDDELKKYLKNLKAKINFKQIEELINKSSRSKVLVIGDMILDNYTFLSPLSKSPKEQIISMQEERAEVYGGGTIASVNHLSNLLKNCTLLSVVGGEKNKIKDYKKLIKKNIKQQLFYDKNFQNIIKKRYLDKNNFNKLFQVTNLKKSNISKKTEIKIIKYLNKNLKNYDHVIVHDFGHGALTDKMINVIEKKSKFLSVNVQTNSSNMGFNYLTKFKKTNYFSIDEPEARLALADDTSDTQKLFQKFKKRIRFKLGSITFGKHGSYLYSSNKAYFSPALTSKPVDTLGAGDSYFVISSLFAKQKAKPDLIAFLGNIAGAFTINYLGHRRYITKVDILNYVKTFLNI